jgi:hypothetical protein
LAAGVLCSDAVLSVEAVAGPLEFADVVGLAFLRFPEPGDLRVDGDATVGPIALVEFAALLGGAGD